MHTARPLPTLFALILGAGAAAQAPERPPASIRWEFPDRPVYQGEVLRPDLVVTVDPAFQRDWLQPVFLRAMDLPVEVQLEGLAGARWERVALPVPTAGTTTAEGIATLALQGDTAQAIADPTTPGRYRLPVRIHVAPDMDSLALPAPRLRVAWAVDFTEDLIRGRVPTATRETILAGEPVTRQVLPLPPNAPAGFTGAIGTLEVFWGNISGETEGSASVNLHGIANFGAFGAPIWEPGDGYVVRGQRTGPVVDKRDDRSQEFSWDFFNPDGFDQPMRPLAFAWFDPLMPGYRELQVPFGELPDFNGMLDQLNGASSWVRYGVPAALGLAFGVAVGWVVRRRRKARSTPSPLTTLRDDWQQRGILRDGAIQGADPATLHQQWGEVLTALRARISAPAGEGAPTQAELAPHGVDSATSDRLAALTHTIRALRFQPDPDPGALPPLATEAATLLQALVSGPLGRPMA